MKKNFAVFETAAKGKRKSRSAGNSSTPSSDCPAVPSTEAPKPEASDAPPAKIQKLDRDTQSPASLAPTPGTTKKSAGSTLEALKLQLRDPGWRSVLLKEMDQTYFKQICEKVDACKKAGKKVFPPEDQIFAAFNHTAFQSIRAVILGQDPYHDDNQAHGLCFSVNRGIPIPPSLKNMYTELEQDIPGFKVPSHGNLEAWAKQGVLLLNATLTVEAHQANSHSGFGWQKFTDTVIKLISSNLSGVVFLLWGGFAQKKAKLIDSKKHHIIQAAHPSPLSVTKWRGCKVFSQTNAYLVKTGKPPIDWQV